MPGLGRPMVAGGRLRHGHVPIPVVLFDLWLRCVVLAKGNDRGCDGMVGRSCCMIGCDRYSPLLILALPSEPVCSMLKARAMMGSECGNGLRLDVCLWRCSGTDRRVHHLGALKGPSILPICTSLAISPAINCQCVSIRPCCSFFKMYCRL